MEAGTNAPDNFTVCKAAVPPPARPQRPAPPEKLQTADAATIRLCESGYACPAVAEIGRPEKLARHHADNLCYRCRSRRADEATRDLEARRRGGAPRTGVC